MANNPNVIKRDGVYYINAIKRCKVDWVMGRLVSLECDIKMLGRHTYIYDDFNRLLYKDDRKYYLEKPAYKTLVESAGVYMAKVYELKDRRDKESISVTSGQYTECYTLLREKLERFTILKESDYFNERKYELKESLSLEDVVKFVSWRAGVNVSSDAARDIDVYRINKLLDIPSANDISDNIIYRMAEENDDELLMCQLRVLYRIDSDDDCKWLSERLRKRVLPHLSGEEGIKYYIKKDSLSDKEIKLLNRSGYRILHKPYFALGGFTKSMWTLDPSKKEGLDAAPVGSNGITFAEYLSLFDKE